MKRKILLIEPPFRRLYKESYSLDRYPLSLGYLAGAIGKGTDWEVQSFNGDFSPKCERLRVGYLTGEGFQNYLRNLQDLSSPVWQEFKAVVDRAAPAVVGISAKSQNFKSACLAAKLVKSLSQEIRVVLGGPHPSMIKSGVLECPDIDVAVKGEGEQTIVDLLRAFEAEKDLREIHGIVYREGKEILENPDREPLEDLDSLNFPHETAKEVLIHFDQYPLTAFRNIFASRGCPYNCFYCGSRNIWGRRVRFRSPEHVAREIKGLEEMGIASIHFDDDTFGINKDYICRLVRAIQTHCPGIKWSCEIHPRLVDEETIDLMKEGGCYLIQVGIESGNNGMLRAIRKNITIEEALWACEVIKKRGIEVQTFFIIGFPEETEETLRDTYQAIKKIRSDSLIYNIFTPYPGTEAFEFCRERGLVDEAFDVALYNHQSPVNCFCLNMDLATFRRHASRIERYIDRKNILNRVRRSFSRNLAWRLEEKGLRGALREAARISLGR